MSRASTSAAGRNLEHADMVAHGTRNVVLSCGGSPADAQGKFRFNWDLLAEKLDLWQKHGFRGPIVMGISTEGIYAKYMKERYGSHLRGVKDPPEEFGREITAMVKAIEAERQKRGWPEFLYYPVDEPSTDAAAVSFMVKVLKACKAAGVRTYVTADPTHDQFEPMRPYVDVWCTQPFAPDRETVLADTKARGVEYWCYPNHVNGENDHTPVDRRADDLRLRLLALRLSHADPLDLLVQQRRSVQLPRRLRDGLLQPPRARRHARCRSRCGRPTARATTTTATSTRSNNSSPRRSGAPSRPRAAPRPRPSRNCSPSGRPSASSPNTSTTTSGRRPNSTSIAGSWRSRSWRCRRRCASSGGRKED